MNDSERVLVILFRLLMCLVRNAINSPCILGHVQFTSSDDVFLYIYIYICFADVMLVFDRDSWPGSSKSQVTVVIGRNIVDEE